ncbi:MAG: amino acid ABC transporter permease [Clostridiales bacterium]|nr:amino acid ABC transporter permease [Clostridiales bacterium]
MLIRGLRVTLEVTLYSVLLGVIIGLITAVIRITEPKGLVRLATAYVEVVRGTPVVVQMVIIYYAILGGSNLPKVLIASIAFGINSGAYVSELIRAGIQAVPRGQMEAARSLGLTWTQAMRFVIVPQAIKNILPALVNEAIVLIKETAVVGYIALDDLTRAGNIIRGRTFDAYTPFLLVALVYLYTTTTLSIFAGKLERRLRESD